MSQNAAQQHHGLLINGREYRTLDPTVSGRDLLAIAGFRPASDYSIVMVIEQGTRAIGLDEKFDINLNVIPKFYIFKGDRLFRALLNEREIVWGEDSIATNSLRDLGEISDDQDLFLDSDRDRAIPDDGVVQLLKEGVERIRSGDPRDEDVEIIINGEAVEINKGRLSFADFAKLAFPELFGRDLICFTVSFTRGPKRRPEGVLLEGDKVRIVEGMVINVSATDKS